MGHVGTTDGMSLALLGHGAGPHVPTSPARVCLGDVSQTDRTVDRGLWRKIPWTRVLFGVSYDSLREDRLTLGSLRVGVADPCLYSI